VSDRDAIEAFIDWLRREGYFMKKVNALGNERFIPTQGLLEDYRLAGGLGRAAALAEPAEEEALF
jgi:hypothetical protein